MVQKLYPCGKKKAFNVTYDDGVLQDVRFVALLNRYGLKGTFNLNSALAEQGFEWTHESGLTVKRLPPEALPALYEGHEVASHTLTHPYLHMLSREEILRELSEDKANLERLFGREIRGFALPFDRYSDVIEDCVKACGFSYARISQESYSFRPQRDVYRWKATIFHCHPHLMRLTQQFLETDEELACMQIVGHSYDLDTEGLWDSMEEIFRCISEEETILPMTTAELIDYLQAMEQAEITDGYIHNHSGTSLWFSAGGRIYEVKAGETLSL